MAEDKTDPSTISQLGLDNAEFVMKIRFKPHIKTKKVDNWVMQVSPPKDNMVYAITNITPMVFQIDAKVFTEFAKGLKKFSESILKNEKAEFDTAEPSDKEGKKVTSFWYSFVFC